MSWRKLSVVVLILGAGCSVRRHTEPTERPRAAEAGGRPLVEAPTPSSEPPRVPQGTTLLHGPLGSPIREIEVWGDDIYFRDTSRIIRVTWDSWRSTRTVCESSGALWDLEVDDSSLYWLEQVDASGAGKTTSNLYRQRLGEPEAEVDVVLRYVGSATAFRVIEGEVYVLTDDALWRVGSGGMTRLADRRGVVGELLGTPRYLYFIDSEADGPGEHAVVRAHDLRSGKTDNFNQACTRLCASESALYCAYYGDGSLFEMSWKGDRVRRLGGASSWDPTVAPNPFHAPYAFTCDEGHLYWTSTPEEGGVLAGMELASAAVTTLRTGLHDAYAIARHSEGLVFSDREGLHRVSLFDLPGGSHTE